VAGFVAAVLVVAFVARRLMLRALAVRDTAAVAEREARAEAERALADLRAAHDELDFLNREKTRFFSLISHDLRGPFNSMLGMTQELADHAPKMPPEEVADFARTVHEMARKVFELLENLLQWSRVQMSGTPFAPTIFPMREVVGDAIRDVASPAQGKEITILDAAGDRWVLADRTMILAVLRNLLMNAVKFSHQGGVVHVTSRALGDRLEVAVTDKGVGMEPVQLELALKGGPKASRPGTQGETGTGLGLTLVRDLVLRHGGELKLESTPGRGTIASFTVPLSTDPAETRRLMQRAAD
jgi:cell cycle sensor histidine kinase DivJ